MINLKTYIVLDESGAMHFKKMKDILLQQDLLLYRTYISKFPFKLFGYNPSIKQLEKEKNKGNSCKLIKK